MGVRARERLGAGTGLHPPGLPWVRGGGLPASRPSSEPARDPGSCWPPPPPAVGLQPLAPGPARGMLERLQARQSAQQGEL